jgi:hypothetical protein
MLQPNYLQAIDAYMFIHARPGWTRVQQIMSLHAAGYVNVRPSIKYNNLVSQQSAQAFLPFFFPVLDLPAYVLPFFLSPWLSPLLSVITSSLPLLIPFYLSTSVRFNFVVGSLKRETLVQSSNCQLPVLPTVAVYNIMLLLGLKTEVLDN